MSELLIVKLSHSNRYVCSYAEFGRLHLKFVNCEHEV